MTPALTPAQARILKAMQEGAIVRAFKNEIGAVAILQETGGFDRIAYSNAVALADAGCVFVASDDGHELVYGLTPAGAAALAAWEAEQGVGG